MNNEDRLNRADAAIDEGNYRAAIIDAKDVLRREPDNVRGRLLLGRASLEVNDGAAAEKEFQRAVELGTPIADVIVGLSHALILQRKYEDLLELEALEIAQTDSSKRQIHQFYGQAYLSLKQPDKARNFFDQVLRTDPDNVDAKLGIVASFDAEGNTLQAKSNIEEIVTRHPDDVRGWITYGRLNLRIRAFEYAEANFGVALRLAEEQDDHSALGSSLEGLADTYLAQGKIEEGRDAVARLQQVAPNRIKTGYLAAHVAFLDSDWLTAQQYLQTVLSVAPEHRQAQMLLGAVHFRSGSLAQAEMYLSTVVAAVPDNLQARNLLAETRLLMDKLDEAQATLQPIISNSGGDPRSLSIAARASVGLGEFDDAVKYLERSLRERPGDVSLQFQLVTTYLSAGRDRDARQLLAEMTIGDSQNDEMRRASLTILADINSDNLDAALAKAMETVEKWPEAAESFRILGTVQILRSDSISARTSFEKAVQLSVNGIDSRRLIAALEIAEGNLGAAQDQYLAIIDAQPDATWAMFALAELGARMGDSEETIKWLERLRSVDPDALAPRAILARFYLLQEEFDAAEVVIREALGLDGSMAELHSILGDVMIRQNKYSDAAGNYRRASELDHENADYRLSYARSQQQDGNDAVAVRALEDNIARTMLHIPSAVQLAALKAKSGDLGAAMTIAERLIESHPESPTPYALMAEVHMRSDNLAAAAHAYDAALDIRVTRIHALRAASIKRRIGAGNDSEPLERFLAERPLDLEIRLLLAESYRRNAALSKSIAEYEKIISAEPDHAVALNNLSWAYYEVHDDRAEDMARKAHDLLPNNGAVNDTLGWILINNDSLDEGADLLRRAVELENGRSQIRYHLAVALSRSGEEDEAREVLEEILSIDDEFDGRSEARKLLSQLN